jgi:hypothetical protein
VPTESKISIKCDGCITLLDKKIGIWYTVFDNYAWRKPIGWRKVTHYNLRFVLKHRAVETRHTRRYPSIGEDRFQPHTWEVQLKQCKIIFKALYNGVERTLLSAGLFAQH